MNSIQPLVSVITVVFNGEKTVRKTIESVISQNYRNIEYVICDGNSTDKTVNIIKEYESFVSYWVSEKDGGVYDAMNKGIVASTGEWVIFIGCDDYFADPESISNMVDKISENEVLVYGNIKYTDGKDFLSKIDKSILIGNTVHHQASLYRKSLFDDFLYSTAHNICSDYELNLRIYLQKSKTSYINETIAVCGVSGISAQQKDRGNEEINLIRGKYMNFINNWLLSILQRVFRISYKIRSRLTI
jgi:putative colanic acid biosynthesis glycosyltransferase